MIQRILIISWLVFLLPLRSEGGDRVPPPKIPEGVTPVAIPPGPGPLVTTKLPNFSRWSIEYTYTGKPGQPAATTTEGPRLVRVETTRTGKIVHVESFFDPNGSGDAWSNGRVKIQKGPGSGKASAVFDLSPASDDFPEFDWISKINYMGVISRDGERCLVFGKNQFTSEGDFIGAAYAYIDITSRLPAAYEINNESRKYSILAPPESALVLPDYAIAAAQGMEAQVKTATPHLGAP
jgi:hypothetical protein